MNDHRHTRLDRYREAVDGRAPAAAPRSRSVAPTQHTTGRFARTGLFTACSTMVALFAAFPPDGQPRWLVLIAALPAAAFGGRSFVRQHRGVPPTRVRVAITAGCAALVLLFGIGQRVQLVIDGKPMLATSQAAQAHDIVAALYADLVELGVHDELLGIEQADARSRYNSYEPAARALRGIANRWSRTDLGSLPDPDLIEVVQHVKTAATFGAEALDMRYQLITEPDDRLAAAVGENRSVFIAEALAAGAKLQPLAERYRVETVPAGVQE